MNYVPGTMLRGSGLCPRRAGMLYAGTCLWLGVGAQSAAVATVPSVDVTTRLFGLTEKSLCFEIAVAVSACRSR
jgi:hypothetical protein